MVRLNLDLSELAAEVQAMADVLGAVESGEDLSQFPDGVRTPNTAQQLADQAQDPGATQS